MLILIERMSFEDRAEFFRKNQYTISRLLDALAKTAKKPKKAAPKTKSIETPVVEETNLSVEELVTDAVTEIALQEDAPTTDTPTPIDDLAELVDEVTESTEEVATPIDSCAPADAPDDLTEIKGVGAKMAENLKLAGITTFEQIANLTEEQITALGKSIRGFAASFKTKDFKKQAQALNQ
jgi:predicted flap endonuclease-1-like 5' DNA nuclease